MALTATQVRQLTEPGKYLDGRGLYLRIAPGGSRQWVLRVSVNGQRREIGLGGLRDVSLSEARAAADAKRTENRQGRISAPVARSVTPTYGELAAAVETAEAWTASTRKAWDTAQAHALPAFGSRRVDAITRADVLAVLLPIFETTPAIGVKTRGAFRKVFKRAAAFGYIDLDPAGTLISGALPTAKKATHHRAADPSAVAAMLADMDRAANVSTATRLAVRFLTLTGVRSGEARAARWSEMDRETATWSIPGDRMKGGETHRVPLSQSALNVLAEAKALDDGSGLCFPSPKNGGRALTDTALNDALKRIGWGGRSTIHGLRTSFRGWATETDGAAWDLVESALAHTIGGSTARAYDRTDRLDGRRGLMARWAEYVTA